MPYQSIYTGQSIDESISINTIQNQRLADLENDIKKAVDMVTMTIALPVSNWSDNTQTINVTDVTSENTIIVSYSPEAYEAYSDAGIRCTGQGNGILTFFCESTPNADIPVNVVILS